MSKRPPSSEVDVRLGAEPRRRPSRSTPKHPFASSSLGDFGGAGAGPLAARKLHAVDRDVLEEEASAVCK